MTVQSSPRSLLYLRLFAITTGLCLPLLLQAQPALSYNHGDPTPAEQLSLEYINRARANPSAEGQRLAHSTDPGVISAINYFSVDIDMVVAAFNTYHPTPPLAFHPDLIRAARRHSRDMINYDQQTHQITPNGPDLRTRTLEAGYTTQSSLRENVYAYVDNPWMGHAGFQIDWGLAPNGIQHPPGHRIAIMDAGSETSPFTEIGIGILADDNPGGTEVYGPYVMTQDFGRPSRPTYYLTGVVYQDNDNDGFYSEGEGLPNVTIMPDRGDYYAVTSSSGGYAIPINDLTGTLTVTASGPGFSSNQTHTVELSGNSSLKLDFMPLSISSNNPFGTDSIRNGNHTKTTWFGGFYDLENTLNTQPGFIFHEEHGYLFYQGHENHLWLYSTSLGWTWTRRDVYPFLYVHKINAWFYYYPLGTQPRFFYNMNSGQLLYNNPTTSDNLTPLN